MSISTPENARDAFSARPSVPSRWQEARRLLMIAGPLAAAYLAELAMSLTTKSIVGQLGYRELAAIGLAADTAAEIVVVLIGLLSVVGVLVAQAEGADRKADAGLAARQGLIVATVLGVTAVQMFARGGDNQITVANTALGTDLNDLLEEDPDLGKLRVGSLIQTEKPSQIGEFSLFLDDNSIEELLLAVAWKSNE